jgi:hypothetical protein
VSRPQMSEPVATQVGDRKQCLRFGEVPASTVLVSRRAYHETVHEFAAEASNRRRHVYRERRL